MAPLPQAPLPLPNSGCANPNRPAAVPNPTTAAPNSTTAFFYGLHIGEEIEIEIDPGKILIIKLISIGEPDNPEHACAPIHGMVTEVAVAIGQEVKAGDKLAVLEAMKMLTTVSASADDTIAQVLVRKGDQVDSDDLLVRIKTE